MPGVQSVAIQSFAPMIKRTAPLCPLTYRAEVIDGRHFKIQHIGMVLLEHRQPQLGVPRDVSMRRRDLRGQELEESRLTSAVLTHNRHP